MEKIRESVTFTAAAIGFRGWGLTEDNLLRSTGRGWTAWRPGVNLAVCRWHDHPHSDCGCGLYACHELSDVVSFSGEAPMIGAIAARGHIESHTDGFRAEEAVIVALATNSADPQLQARAVLVAAYYQVPLVAADELVAIAARYGAPVPRNQRPEPSSRQSADADPCPRRPGLLLTGIAFIVSCQITLVTSNWPRVIVLFSGCISAGALGLLALRWRTAHWRASRVSTTLVSILLSLLAIGGIVRLATFTDNSSSTALNSLITEAQTSDQASGHWPLITTLPSYPQALAANAGLRVLVDGRCRYFTWIASGAVIDAQRVCPRPSSEREALARQRIDQSVNHLR
jgi:hypothetical protein